MFFCYQKKFLLHQVAYYPNFFNFPSIFGHPEGRGKATPSFRQKLKFGIFQNSFGIE